MSGPLLETVRGLLERTYGIDSGLGELGAFVIGDLGFRTYTGHDSSINAAAATGAPGTLGARTLVRDTGDGLRACIYFPDALIEQLEAFPPQRGLLVDNVDEFATFVEEIDHLLVIAERARQGLATSLFELELHANVSKHLVLSRFLAGSRSQLGAGRRRWLRERLFTGIRYADPDAAVRRRYEDALRWAIKLVDGATGLAPARRLATLRQFHRAGAGEKLRLIQQLGG